MKCDVKLFVSSHKADVHIPDNPLLKPIQVGSIFAKDLVSGWLHDCEGDNISEKNKSYCELTAQYWVWKNCSADYYGFLHYRRYFNFSTQCFPIHHEPFIFGDVVFDSNDDEFLRTICFDEASMRAVIESHDFIAPEPISSVNGETIYEQYAGSVGHHIEDLDMVLDIIKRRYPAVWKSAQKYVTQSKQYVCNMFIMRKQLFEAYSSFLFDILFEFERLTDISHYTTIGRRVVGYLAERLCGVYLTYLFDQGYDGIELQRVYFRQTGNQNSIDRVKSLCDVEPSCLTLESTSRGDGKIYSTICSLPEHFDGVVHAQVLLEHGSLGPAKVVRVDETWVLVLPILSVSQTVQIKAYDGQGILVGESEETFSPRWSKLKSQKNTLLKNETALLVRNCDKRPLPGDVRVKMTRVIESCDGSDILQGVVSYAAASNDDQDYIEITALAEDGSIAVLGDWVCLSDETTAIDGYGGLCFRTIQYSLKTRRSDSYTVWAQFPGSARQDGFSCIEPGGVEDMRQAWHSLTTPACNSAYYEEWYLTVHQANKAELSFQRETSFPEGPLFSIIVPLYKTPVAFFIEMIESVISQTYDKWELILVNASPEDSELLTAVQKYQKTDKRVRLVTLTSNLGITENTNEGINVAKGDFLSFFDHDDVLEPDALFCYARAISENSQIDMLYCDEDKLCEGSYINPYFKPDWDPYLLLGMNYVCHFLTVRKAVLDSLCLPTRKYDGSQDYHMTFRIGELARKVHHEPRVLYHWRVHQHSTAMSASQKNYALETSRLSVETHLKRRGLKGTVNDSPLSPRRFVVDYDLGDNPLVSIIIPNKDAIRVLSRCLVSIAMHTSYDNYEIIIVENNSVCPETFEYYEQIQREYSNVRVVEEGQTGEFNYSRTCNFGASHARGDYYLMLNNDTRVKTKDWIEQLLGTCMLDKVGVVGAKLLFPDETVQHAGVTFGVEGPCHLSYQRPAQDGGNFESALLEHKVVAVTGACMITKRTVYKIAGGFDESLPVNYNDVDYCLKVMKLGFDVVFRPTAQLYHYESVSRGSEIKGSKAVRFRSEKGDFMKRWPEVFELGDPCGNPNLLKGSSYEVLGQMLHREPWI